MFGETQLPEWKSTAPLLTNSVSPASELSISQAEKFEAPVCFEANESAQTDSLERLRCVGSGPIRTVEIKHQRYARGDLGRMSRTRAAGAAVCENVGRKIR